VFGLFFSDAIPARVGAVIELLTSPWLRRYNQKLSALLLRIPHERVMKTFSAKAHEVERDWFVVDATDKVLGRLAAGIAHRLRGKHKPEFTPHVDTGDYIVVVNAAKLRVTGNKSQDKMYYRHSGYPGGVTETSFGKMQARFPGRALEKAVKGMLPKGPLGYAMIKKLKVYAEGTHPHAAQQPKVLEV
jgi:large subunit ribosomal protein L13